MSTHRTLLAALAASAALVLAACSQDLPDQAIRPAADDAAAASPSLPAGGEVEDSGAELDLEDQSGDGSAVVVEEVGLASGHGLVLVTRAGETRPIGAAVVRDGGARGLTVVLNERLTQDTRIRAVLFVDVDEDGAFDPAEDSVVVDNDGDVEADDADYRLF